MENVIKFENKPGSESSDDMMTNYLVILISSISVICLCILIVAYYLWIRKRESFTNKAEREREVPRKGTEQQNNPLFGSQRDAVVPRGSNESMYIDRNERVADYGEINDQNEYGDGRKEGEPTTVTPEVPDTDDGDV